MSEAEGQDSSDEFWLFGYGSLIWKPPPHYDLRIPGHIKGYVRRFWQASEDHRGTPASPGRVVTLITQSYYSSLSLHEPRRDAGTAAHDDDVDEDGSDDAIVRGVAYRIPAPHVEEVKRYLDIREINGYSIEYTVFYPCTNAAPPRGVISGVLVYIGLPSNPQFLGVQTQEEVAGVIARSEGPSGRNDEYLFMLERGLRELGEEDEHVGGLARRVRVLLGEEGGADRGEEGGADRGEEAVGMEMKRVETGQGGEPAEETEKMAVAERTDE